MTYSPPKTFRAGAQMRNAVQYVTDHPGCCIADVARAISPCPIPESNWAYGYNPVHRAIDAGLILADIGTSGRYALTVPTRK